MPNTRMRSIPAAAALLIVCAAAAPASAQRRFGVDAGVSVTWVEPASDELSTKARVRPLVRLTPRRGWGPAGAFNWFDADVDGTLAGVGGPVGELRIRPLMGGVGYTIGSDRATATFSVVGGPSWNRIEFDEAFRDRLGAAGVPVDSRYTGVSVAVRPGASVTWTLAPRLHLTGFGGYLINRPAFDIQGVADDEARWSANSVVLSVGIVYSIF